MSKKKQSFQNQTYTINGKIFKFSEADEDAYFYAWKDGDNFAFIMFVSVIDKETGEGLAFYEKTWESHNAAHISAFIRKFMKNPEYRKQYQINGTVIDDVLNVDKQTGFVNPQCEKRIKRLNSMNSKQLRFADFANLKTFGMDKISRQKEDALEKALNADDVALARAQLPPNKVVTALRWMKRGLRTDLAIHKVLVDMEIAQNAIGMRY